MSRAARADWPANPRLNVYTRVGHRCSLPTAPSSATDGLRRRRSQLALQLSFLLRNADETPVRANSDPRKAPAYAPWRPPTMKSRAAATRRSSCAQSRRPPVAQRAPSYESSSRADIARSLAAAAQALLGRRQAWLRRAPGSRAPIARPTPTLASGPSRAANDEETRGAAVSELAHVALRVEHGTFFPFSFARPYRSLSEGPLTTAFRHRPRHA
ncbi:hypothetical protein B0H15DRAFT_958054 [Mycena belliarum]|uniref:Uncharacterized protein n=1 Tax=Mycena belliarum TaxID=1033014 RepID=A0AAD6XKY3_9AGAR|nr:hypothetical protein B0H15DRAFT_958054 [Mycena belliae]